MMEVMQEPTVAAFSDPKPGDRFHEMYSFWMYVLEVAPDGGEVVAMHAHPPCTLPGDGLLKVYASAAEFREAYAYKSIPGYTCRLADRGNSIEGWREQGRVE